MGTKHYYVPENWDLDSVLRFSHSRRVPSVAPPENPPPPGAHGEGGEAVGHFLPPIPPWPCLCIWLASASFEGTQCGSQPVGL